MFSTRFSSPLSRVASKKVAAVALVLASGTLAACSTAADTSGTAGATGAAALGGESDTATVSLASASELGGVGSLDSSSVHELSISFDDDAYDAMLAVYQETGEKDWIDATVTIDGTTYDEVGIRLKGNSSLRGVTESSTPESLPWLIRLDKFVDDQSHEGLTDLVVRSNTTETALNEAVALELLELAGLASQDAIATSFSVNGSASVLRLVIENPDDEWMAEEFDDTGALYKAESTGDYTYRGDDPDSYDEVFDQEAGDDNADLTELIEFLDFVNNTDDDTFESELGDHLDIEAFATYLAMQDLIDNFDDIDGPGNNSYLYLDTETDRFTVVAWDHNLAFG
ncbi:MAG: CotH kinase family protein, partial [Ilumatobacteraceae bacterium]